MKKLTSLERELNVKVNRLSKRVDELERELHNKTWEVENLKRDNKWLEDNLPTEKKYNAYEIYFDGDFVDIDDKEYIVKRARRDCLERYDVDEYPYIDNVDDAVRYLEEHGYTVYKARLMY